MPANRTQRRLRISAAVEMARGFVERRRLMNRVLDNFCTQRDSASPQGC